MLTGPLGMKRGFPHFAKRCLVLLVSFSLNVTAAMTQVDKKPLTATERLIRRYEKLIASGDLLTPAGWNRASKLFEKSEAYPQDGEISVVSTGGLVGEDWVHGDRAQVDTKWNDYYGTIDSALRLKPPTPSGSIVMAETFSLVFVRPPSNDAGRTTVASSPTAGEWKFEGALRTRSATIPEAIEYVEKMRDQSNDPAIRKNAGRTIAALKRLMRGRSAACAC